MSLTLGGVEPSSSSAVKAAHTNSKTTPNPNQPMGTLKSGGAPSMDYVSGILSRVIRPMEFRDLEPQEMQDIDLPKIEVHRVEPLDRPHPDQVEARSYDTVEVRSLELVEALEVERLDIRQFDFPDPAELRPQDLKDFGRPYVEGPDIMTIEASELKPAVRFEDLFFQPREYLQAETYDPVEFETVSPEPYRGQKAQYLDVADPDTYNNEARGPELHPRAALAYQDRLQVVHKFSHDSMSHFHYHYQAVPADDVPAHRDRSVYLG